MDMDFEVNMNEYLPLRDVVFNTLRKAILRGEEKGPKRQAVCLNAGAALYIAGKAGRTADGDPACQQAWSKPHPDP